MTSGECIAIQRVSLLSSRTGLFDRWSVSGIRALKECSKKITSLAQAKELRGVGDKTAEKVSACLCCRALE